MIYESFKIIVFTSPEFDLFNPEESVRTEARRIEQLLSNSADLPLGIHLRKPGVESKYIAEILSLIPFELRKEVTLHDHFSLASYYGAGGVHLNSRTPRPPTGFKGRISRSCHTVEEVLGAREMDYVTLSPVFNSISKKDYPGKFSPLNGFRITPDSPPVIALGGITPEYIPVLRQAGFAGAAFLGYASNLSPVEFIRHVKKWNNKE